MNDLDERRRRLDELQRLLLPAALPTIGCTEAAAAYRSSNHKLELGGDWFDLIDRPDSNTVVAIIGDVVGHGVRQIGVMGQLRSAAAALAGVVEDPADILAGLDRFAATVPGAEFATVGILVLRGSDQAQIASAGHPPPIRVDAAGEPHLIEAGRRPPLTLTAIPADGVFDLQTDELIVLYTDGVVERVGQNIDLGITALSSYLASRSTMSCKDLADAIVDEFGADATDDQAVIVLRPIHNRGAEYQLQHRTPSHVSIGRPAG